MPVFGRLHPLMSFSAEIYPGIPEATSDKLGDLFARWLETGNGGERGHAVVPLTPKDIRTRREAAGVTLEAISERTKVPLQLFEGLENGNFDGWPAGLFSRAFVRSYALETRVDPGELLALFESSLPPDESMEHIRQTRSKRATDVPSTTVATAGAIAGVTAVCAVLIVMLFWRIVTGFG